MFGEAPKALSVFDFNFLIPACQVAIHKSTFCFKIRHIR